VTPQLDKALTTLWQKWTSQYHSVNLDLEVQALVTETSMKQLSFQPSNQPCPGQSFGNNGGMKMLAELGGAWVNVREWH
jgi:hypothetical protein